MAMARRVSLFEREVTVRLAPVALELLHGAARVLTEGELAGDGYTGSTMLTIDLARTADRISDAPDPATAQRAAALYADDERCASTPGGSRSRKRAGSPAATWSRTASTWRAGAAAASSTSASTSRPSASGAPSPRPAPRADRR